MNKDFSTPESIRAALLSEDVVDPNIDSRLTTPLSTAYRNVAQAVAVMPTLRPQQRKAAAITLIDISNSALQAIQKMLKRNGSSDPAAYTLATKLIKQIASLSEMLDTLTVDESKVMEDVPPEFDSGDLPSDTIDVIAARILRDNSDATDKSLADGDPAKTRDEDPEPEEGSEASPEDLKLRSDGTTDKVIDTLADTEVPKESILPKPFVSKESVDTDTRQNIRILESILANAR